MADSKEDEINPTMILLIKQMEEQNKNTGKLAENVGELATKIAVSLERHNTSEEKQQKQDERIEQLEHFKERSKPVIDRSKWWQDTLSDFAKTKVIPGLIIAVLASAGFSIYSSNVTVEKQSQEQDK